jgi:glycosyltransferase involved in cell wall biosynthesis
MNYLVTVLVCVHSINNFYDSLLLKSIESLENQTYKNFKTIIVLDECWVNTELLILSKKYNLDILIVSKTKKTGLSNAKNHGLKFVETEWVAFLDGDDFYLPYKLEEQINYIKNNKVDFLGCHSWNINNNDEDNLFPSCFESDLYNHHEEIKNKIFFENVLTHGSMMIKKECLLELGGYNNIKGQEDWDLWKRAINNGFMFYQLPQRLYVYRLNTSVKR